MPVLTRDLWSLVLDCPHVAPEDLAQAVAELAQEPGLDFRSRLLIRDCMVALQQHWGVGKFDAWLRRLPDRERLQAIERESLGPIGFPYLGEQIMEPLRRETIEQMLRELGDHVHHPTTLYIGGSVALIVPGFLSRRTQDMGVVDEVPAEIRGQHQFLNDLMQRYRLRLSHFQSHYLPKDWQQRAHSLGLFGKLQVFLVAVYDVFLSKLFSAREKDRDDLRALVPQLDREILERRCRTATGPLRADPRLLPHAEKNWYILFGEALPS